MKILLFGMLALSMACSTAQAETTSPPREGVIMTQDEASNDSTAMLEGIKNPDQIRCKRMPVTGSRVGKNVCHTNAEWAAMDKGAKQFLQDLSGTPTGSPYGEGRGIQTPTSPDRGF